MCNSRVRTLYLFQVCGWSAKTLQSCPCYLINKTRPIVWCQVVSSIPPSIHGWLLIAGRRPLYVTCCCTVTQPAAARRLSRFQLFSPQFSWGEHKCVHIMETFQVLRFFPQNHKCTPHGGAQRIVFGTEDICTKIHYNLLNICRDISVLTKVVDSWLTDWLTGDLNSFKLRCSVMHLL